MKQRSWQSSIGSRRLGTPTETNGQGNLTLQKQGHVASTRSIHRDPKRNCIERTVMGGARTDQCPYQGAPLDVDPGPISAAANLHYGAPLVIRTCRSPSVSHRRSTQSRRSPSRRTSRTRICFDEELSSVLHRGNSFFSVRRGIGLDCSWLLCYYLHYL
jgi:hypothetical protein